MTKLKVIGFMNCFFKLPDDFTGTLSDAMRLMADYHEQKAGTEAQVIGPVISGPAHTEEYKKAWYKFLGIINEGKRLSGGVIFAIQEEKKMLKLDVNGKMPKA